jgi:hypothetical protein
MFHDILMRIGEPGQSTTPSQTLIQIRQAIAVGFQGRLGKLGSFRSDLGGDGLAQLLNVSRGFTWRCSKQKDWQTRLGGNEQERELQSGLEIQTM